MTRCAGTSRLHETIYEDRLEWLGELRKMGAVVEKRFGRGVLVDCMSDPRELLAKYNAGIIVSSACMAGEAISCWRSASSCAGE